jgi:hypothetical protein
LIAYFLSALVPDPPPLDGAGVDGTPDPPFGGTGGRPLATGLMPPFSI